MEPYHRYEVLEDSMRFQTVHGLAVPVRMWLKAFALFQEPFKGAFDWVAELSPEQLEEKTVRADLLALAASSSKPALDTLLAGYYWPASGLVRSLLDSARRVQFLRLAGPEAIKYFAAPSKSPVDDDGKPSKEIPRLKYETMEDVAKNAYPEEYKAFDFVSIGTKMLDWGAHPSGEGILQLYAGAQPHKVVGPTFYSPFAAFLIKWSLVAHLALLEELHILRPQSADWLTEYRRLGDEFAQWHKAEAAEEVREVEAIASAGTDVEVDEKMARD